MDVEAGDSGKISAGREEDVVAVAVKEKLLLLHCLML
jgi:hypothetical protein